MRLPGDGHGVSSVTVALLAGFWSIRLTHAVWRQVASGLCLFPVLLVVEVVGWSHGWVVGCVVLLLGYVVATITSVRVPPSWAPAVGGSALILGVSVVFGLVPSVVALVTRMGLAVGGSWREPRALPFDLSSGDVGPWLLPLNALVVLALLPRITIVGNRLPVDPHLTAGVVVAALGVLPMLYGAGFWVSMTAFAVVAVALLWAAWFWRNDVLLLLAWAPLLILRICSYYVDPVCDDLADPRLDAVCDGRPGLGADRATPRGQGLVPHGRRPLRPGRSGAVAGLWAGAPIDPGLGWVGDRRHRVVRADCVTESVGIAEAAEVAEVERDAL
jgi:hypothetical protein